MLATCLPRALRQCLAQFASVQRIIAGTWGSGIRGACNYTKKGLSWGCLVFHNTHFKHTKRHTGSCRQEQASPSVHLSVSFFFRAFEVRISQLHVDHRSKLRDNPKNKNTNKIFTHLNVCSYFALRAIICSYRCAHFFF